jgi:hypothetical protein
MVMIIRTMAPPIKIPMFEESPSFICCVNAGVPEISTVTPGGASAVSMTAVTVSSTAFLDSSESDGSILIWMSVSTFEGTSVSRTDSGNADTIVSTTARSCGSVPPFPLFR